MRTGSRALLLFLFTAAFGACAGSGTSSRSSGNRDIITLAEIQETQAATAYDIVQELRPRWMIRNRGERSFNETSEDFLKIILDDLPPREFNFLREIPRDVLVEIRYISPRDATMRYGTGHNSGVLLVTTRH